MSTGKRKEIEIYIHCLLVTFERLAHTAKLRLVYGILSSF